MSLGVAIFISDPLLKWSLSILMHPFAEKTSVVVTNRQGHNEVNKVGKILEIHRELASGIINADEEWKEIPFNLDLTDIKQQGVSSESLDGGITESMNQPGIKEDIHCKNSKLEGGNYQKYDQPGLKEYHNNEAIVVVDMILSFDDPLLYMSISEGAYMFQFECGCSDSDCITILGNRLKHKQPRNFAWEIADSGSVKSVFKAWEQGLSSFEYADAGYLVKYRYAYAGYLVKYRYGSGIGEFREKQRLYLSSSSSHEVLKPYNSSKTQDVPQPHKSSSRHEILKPSKLSKIQHVSHPHKSVRENDIQLEDEEIQEEVQTESEDVPQSYLIVRENMDKSWMNIANRLSDPRYELGVNEFLDFLIQAVGSGTPAEICLKLLKRVPGHLRGRSAPKKEILAVENLRAIVESEKNKSAALEEKMKEVAVEQDEMKKCMGLMMKEIQRLSKLVPDKSTGRPIVYGLAARENMELEE
uniref:Uncharacterized protein n=1 Tax=Tanacetum cinerariifolium TaxID=118510 RepID=A0A6L2MHU3_TANCI|nr:hypothetical protein [Tanacetum cinerariifolium]